MEPRSVAMYLLCVLSFSLAQWTYGRNRFARLTGALVSLLAAAIIFFTLSRMASVMVILLFGAFLIKPLGMRRVVMGGLIAILTASVVFLAVPSFRAHFFFNPDSITRSFAEMDVNAIVQSVNTMGRSAFWLVTIEHALERPLVGWGLGSARLIVAELLPRKSVQEYQPHNEYLQILHDLGFIGLAIMLIAWLPLLYAFWRKWRYYDRARDPLRAKWNMAATLGITVVLLTSLTGTTLHYPPITVTVFIIATVAYYLNGLQAGPNLSDSASPDPSLIEHNTMSS
jgi:O-antigen ligase